MKVRISKTMLKWGEMQPTAPVFAAGGSRLFPQTATGFQLQSSELEGLDLEAGHFTEGKQGTPPSRAANSTQPMQARPPRAPISLGPLRNHR